MIVWELTKKNKITIKTFKNQIVEDSWIPIGYANLLLTLLKKINS